MQLIQNMKDLCSDDWPRRAVPVILATCLFLAISCSKKSIDDPIVQVENMIIELYNESLFDWSSEKTSKLSTVELYMKIEEYYLSHEILESTDEMGYRSLYKNYIKRDSVLDLYSLYEKYPAIASLESPSNYTLNFIVFEQALEAYNGQIPDNSSLFKAAMAISDMYSTDFNFEKEGDLFNNYLSSIDNQDFENKIVYRIPIIAMSHVVFINRFYDARLINQDL